MSYRWENVTERMRIVTIHKDAGIEIAVYFGDVTAGKDRALFIIDSEDIYPYSKRHAVHTKYEDERRYAYLLKRPSGNLKALLDETEFRLSTSLCIGSNDFSNLTSLRLEYKVRTPVWEEITSQCKPLLVKSSQSDGFYVKLSYKGAPVALLGEHKASVMMANGTSGKFKVEKAKNATISFHVFKKNNA